MRLFPAQEKNLTEERIEREVRAKLTWVRSKKYLYMKKEDQRLLEGMEVMGFFVLKNCLGKEK
jgi:acetone carboxylase gamma subunit